MIKVAVMLLSIIAILCMLYPIRPGYRNKERFYSGNKIRAPDPPSGSDQETQKIFRNLISTQNQLDEDSKYDTISPEQEDL